MIPVFGPKGDNGFTKWTTPCLEYSRTSAGVVDKSVATHSQLTDLNVPFFAAKAAAAAAAVKICVERWTHHSHAYHPEIILFLVIL